MGSGRRRLPSSGPFENSPPVGSGFRVRSRRDVLQGAFHQVVGLTMAGRT